ncbi:MAG: TIM barrel protein [Desulfobacterales bacterium]|jgi:hypothetical protein|nr:TIM barrel protein [Desulfobacterales bacterium]
MNRTLSKSYKGRFPFRIGSTSFIYPDSYVSNVNKLGAHLDEVELLLFESSLEGSLPSEKEIYELAILAKEFDLTYNIHLPIDISMGDMGTTVRDRAVEVVKYVINLTESLLPTTHTLHLENNEILGNEDIKKWQERIHSSIKQLIDSGIDSRSISIETLSYPFELVEDVLLDLDLSVCIDIGHLILYGFDINEVFLKYSDRTTIIHLHGVEKGKDHLSIDKLPETEIEKVMKILKAFSGTLSLEVFSFEALNSSLLCLDDLWIKYE